jgi:hypothetical protein
MKIVRTLISYTALHRMKKEKIYLAMIAAAIVINLILAIIFWV